MNAVSKHSTPNLLNPPKAYTVKNYTREVLAMIVGSWLTMKGIDFNPMKNDVYRLKKWRNKSQIPSTNYPGEGAGDDN